MEGYWKMLDNMAGSNPEEYKKFIDKNMEEMKQHDQEETKREELQWSIQSTPYFSFYVKPAQILTHDKTKAPNKRDDDIKLFDFAGGEEIKESFERNTERTEPLEGPKLYLNVVYHDRVLPPLNEQRNLADPINDATWQVIPICFTVPIKRRNMSNIECWHFDAHINTCVVEKMRASQDRFRAVWNHIILRFQNHLKEQYVFHKRSIKLSKLKKYKNPMGNSQTVAKYTLPKECEKNFYVKNKKKLDERRKKAAA